MGYEVYASKSNLPISGANQRCLFLLVFTQRFKTCYITQSHTKMEYDIKLLESSEEMFMPLFGQDDFAFSLFQGEEKSENIDNVLVEKFVDYGVSTAAEIDTDFEGMFPLC